MTRDGLVKAAAIGSEGFVRYTHRFPGAHSQSQVEGAVTLAIAPAPAERSTGRRLAFRVAVDNRKSGHSLPTGSSDPFGLRRAAQNIALNRALLEARRTGEIPSTLRFLRFAPCVLLGCDQSAEQELNLDYCGANQIAVQRRITGGAASYLDENQIGWELYLHRRDVGAAALQVVSRQICHAAATGISALGMDARVERPRRAAKPVDRQGCGDVGRPRQRVGPIERQGEHRR